MSFKVSTIRKEEEMSHFWFAFSVSYNQFWDLPFEYKPMLY